MYYITLKCIYVTILVVENVCCELVSVALYSYIDLAQQLRRIMLANEACLPVLLFPHFLYISRKSKKLLNIKYVICLQN